MDLLGAISDAGALEDPEGALRMLGYDPVEVFRSAELQAGAVLDHLKERDVEIEVTAGPACEWDNVDERTTVLAVLVLGLVGGIIAQREKATDELTNGDQWDPRGW